MASRKPSTEIPAKRAAASRQDDRDEQFHVLLRTACIKAAGVGALSALVGAIPGAGVLLRFTLGELVDVAAVTAIQEQLIEDTLTLYELPLPDALRKPLIVQISSLGAGASIGVDALGRTLLGRFGSKLGGPVFGRVVPLIGVMTSAIGNAATTYAIGRRAEAFAKMGAAPADTLADVFRAFTGVDERRIWEWSLAATKEALSTVGRVTAKVKGMNPFARFDEEAAPAGAGPATQEKNKKSTKSEKAGTPRKPRAAAKKSAAGPAGRKTAARKAPAKKPATAKTAAKSRPAARKKKPAE
ncbi:hypothetical protein [Tahibacter harae]|uniref:DUF697 domain-containing protein n=1 Tax=Tahibacter harae TaxID=2963937 RepID=A0ABT1QMM0_9GAMM|nr:hypothetical protein [Tahibacter harae]MCQ4163128.1 hypothetical protein [Tahibacter harae]